MPWRCARGHEWEAKVSNRSNGSGCPFCTNRKVLSGFNDLLTTHPGLAQEAQFDPTHVSAGSNKKLPWRCKFGHEWVAQVNDRTQGAGCPVCAGKRVEPGFNDLATARPDIAREAQFDATNFTPNSNRIMDWRCSTGHTWKASIASRTRGSGCPICGGSQVLAGFNDLATTHPTLAVEAIFDPTTVSAGSNKKLPWRCSLGHVWNAPVANRKAGRGCPVCSNVKVVPGINDLASSYPALAQQALFDASAFSSGSSQRVTWRCLEGHEWQATIISRVQGSGCPVCSFRKVVKGVNDLETTHPDLAKEAQFDATKFTKVSKKKVAWRCASGHIWLTSIQSRVGGSQCLVCQGQQTLAGFNDLATTHPQLAQEALFDPTKVVAGSNKKLPWRCVEGHQWSAIVNNRRKGVGCPYCANQKLLVGFNDLATTHPNLASEALFDPTTVTRGHRRKKLPWRCAEGHEWTSTVAHRTSDKSGCPTCAKYGYDPAKPGWIYLMAHDQWFMQQIGITNEPEVRIKTHEKHGWEVMDLRGPMSGSLAREWESSILAFIRSTGVRLLPSGGTAPLRSFKETDETRGEAWRIADLSAMSVWELMEAVQQIDD